MVHYDHAVQQKLEMCIWQDRSVSWLPPRWGRPESIYTWSLNLLVYGKCKCGVLHLSGIQRLACRTISAPAELLVSVLSVSYFRGQNASVKHREDNNTWLTTHHHVLRWRLLRMHHIERSRRAHLHLLHSHHAARLHRVHYYELHQQFNSCSSTSYINERSHRSSDIISSERNWTRMKTTEALLINGYKIS